MTLPRAFRRIFFGPKLFTAKDRHDAEPLRPCKVCGTPKRHKNQFCSKECCEAYRKGVSSLTQKDQVKVIVVDEVIDFNQIDEIMKEKLNALSSAASSSSPKTRQCSPEESPPSNS